ncbi:hypothetical protein PaG_00445 [Moesziomyces aphidis]|uniref:Uncharacterized protein n=1 Tax=Moesziomyces aphidis TaxID=84754 RepID=W3VW35_MOEAP|nr:hypothetical protein PaG_00445 [Moesziomyces aphidis]
MVRELLLMGQEYVQGSLPRYPIALGNTTSKPARAFFTGDQKTWAETELQRSGTTQVQGGDCLGDIAERFSDRTLIGKYILDRWGVVLAFQSFGDKHKAYYKSAFPITGQSPEVIEANTRKQKMCSASKRWAPSSRVVHLGPKLLACRAAGGMRQGGSMMQMDSDTLECRTRTAPLS